MISTEMKIKKSKQAIKYIIFASAFYLVICVAAILDALLITPNEGVAIFSAPMVFMYLLTITSIFVLTYNVLRYHNSEMIRKKAVHDYDERNFVVQERTNSATLKLVCLLLMFGLLLSLYLNSVELFAFCSILILLIIVSHVVIKILVNRKL